jgi:hypothetical protein
MPGRGALQLLPVGRALPAPGARVEVEFNVGAYAGTVGRVHRG